MNDILLKLQTIELDKKKIMLIGVFLILLLFADFTYVVKFQLLSLSAASKKVAKLQKDLSVYRKDLARLQEINSSQPKDAAGAKGKKFIAKDGLSVFLSEISTIANKNNVKIIQMRPLVKEANPKDKDASRGPQNYNQVMIQLDLVCNYSSLRNFLMDLEKADKFVAFENLKMLRIDDDLYNENVTLLLKTYAAK